MKVQNIGDMEQLLQATSTSSIRDLYEIWEQRQPVVLNQARTAVSSMGTGQIRWLQSDVNLAAAFVRHALENEEFLLACDAFSEAFAFWNGRPEADIGQLTALCCSYSAANTRLGQIGEALRQLEPWSRDSRLSRRERAGVFLQLGDIMREESDSASQSAARLQSGEHALEYYQQALGLMPAFLEANVRCASMALRMGESTDAKEPRAKEWATNALILISERESDSGSSFRLHLSKAVALVVLGRLEEAAGFYTTLKSFPDVTTAELADARYESQRLAEAIGKPTDYFKPAFPPLQLIVFAGHMPDQESATPRFPPESIPDVQRELGKKLEELQVRTAVVSAAAGADLLFIEALMERPGAKLNLVLPWSQEEFFRTSVEPFDRGASVPRWRPLFEKALQKASSVRQLGQLYEPGDEVGWQYAEEVSAGIALQTARQCRLDVQPIALWDRRPGRGAGGTASFCELWARCLVTAPIILDMPSENGIPVAVENRVFGRSERSTLHREVKTILFADIVGYSRLTEKAIQEFLSVFLRRLSKLIAETPHSPICIDMWGDAIYAVFDFATDAGLFATQLTSFVHDGLEEWLRQGLYFEETGREGEGIKKVPLNIRVGLHTGPVLAHYNHVLRKLSYTGSHVSRAARLEPVAHPGEVYTSEEFAAMVALESGIRNLSAGLSGSEISNGLDCEYAGSISLAKHYPGRFRIYRVREKRNLPLEQLAVAAHSLYCADQMQRGLSPKDVPALLPWEQLPEDLRQANRSQVADIPYKLSLVGYELTTGPGELPRDLSLSRDEVDRLAEEEHDRWMKDRKRRGWRYSSVRDNARKLHPSMVVWKTLPEAEKEKDRAVIRNLPKLIEMAGLRFRKQTIRSLTTNRS